MGMNLLTVNSPLPPDDSNRGTILDTEWLVQAGSVFLTVTSSRLNLVQNIS